MRKPKIPGIFIEMIIGKTPIGKAMNWCFAKSAALNRSNERFLDAKKLSKDGIAVGKMPGILGFRTVG